MSSLIPRIVDWKEPIVNVLCHSSIFSLKALLSYYNILYYNIYPSKLMHLEFLLSCQVSLYLEFHLNATYLELLFSSKTKWVKYYKETTTFSADSLWWHHSLCQMLPDAFSKYHQNLKKLIYSALKKMLLWCDFDLMMQKNFSHR